MADAPRFGTPNKLYRLGLIGDRKCPDCRAENPRRGDVELHPAGESTLQCKFGHTFEVAGGVP